MLLLPYLEEAQQYESYNLSKPVDDPTNLPITSQPLPVYLCPSMVQRRVGPDLDRGEELAVGSYGISRRTKDSGHRRLEGAF